MRRVRLREYKCSHISKAEISGIASCKTAIADDVAEWTLGEIIVGLRQVPANAAANRAGIGAKPERIRVLSQSTVGIVGASEVGKRVAKRLESTGCRILIFDPFLSGRGAQVWRHFEFRPD